MENLKESNVIVGVRSSISISYPLEFEDLYFNLFEEIAFYEYAFYSKVGYGDKVTSVEFSKPVVEDIPYQVAYLPYVVYDEFRTPVKVAKFLIGC